MKILAKDKHDKKRRMSEIIGITRDGWVITKDGAFGDVHQDCEIVLDIKNYLKDFRKTHNLSQQEVGWMIGKSRPTIISLEQGKRELTLKEFLILASYLPETSFAKLRKQIEKPPRKVNGTYPLLTF